MAIQLRTLYEMVTAHKEFEMDLIAGENGLDKVVGWVHMVEGKEISSFLEGDEIAFTTGIALSDLDELDELVKLNYTNGASGMVINIGPYISHIPDKIITFCNQYDFALFTVPWHVHMAKIMKLISEQITFSTQSHIELVSALKNAIFYPMQQDLYIPILDRYGYDQEASYCVGLIKIAEVKHHDAADVSIDNLTRIIESYIVIKQLPILIFKHKDTVVLIYAACEDAEIVMLSEDIVAHCRSKFKSNLNLYCGIGRKTKSARCIDKSYRLAQRVLNLQFVLAKVNSVAAYKNLGIYKVLMAIEDTELISEYFEDTLLPLIQYDEINNSDYMDFLKCHFELGCNAQETAKKLFLHRNSINYKLHRIEEIIGRDISDLNEKTEIYIALKLYELL